MSRPARLLLFFVLVLTLAVPARAAEIQDILGVAHAGGKYGFTGDDYLNEGADRLLELGTRVIKVWFQRDGERAYRFNSDWGPPATDLAELARKPYYQELFAKPFTTFILVVESAAPASFLDGMSPEEIEAEREQIHGLARHLLEQYAGSGKTFILQNWEGDHLLRQRLAPEAEPDATRLQGMRDWWNARQDGVEQARREVEPRGVMVAHAAEVNLLAQSMEGKITATNAVVPFTRADLYSYSSWDLRFDRRRLTEALDYLQRMAPDSELYGEHNVYLGEFGAVKDQVGEGVSLRNTIHGLAEAALGWGARYVVFWQVFCNEAAKTYEGRPRNSDMRGFWLIRPDGSKAPSWRTFQRRMPAARTLTRMRAATGQFVGAENGGDDQVFADRWRPLPFTKFAINDLNGAPLRSGDRVAIQAHHGFYLTVEDGGGGPVYANRAEVGENEVFRIWKARGTGTIRRGDEIALQARSGRYLRAEPGSREVGATGLTLGPGETFRLLGVRD